jgi:hypothetical protein
LSENATFYLSAPPPRNFLKTEAAEEHEAEADIQGRNNRGKLPPAAIVAQLQSWWGERPHEPQERFGARRLARMLTHQIEPRPLLPADFFKNHFAIAAVPVKSWTSRHFVMDGCIIGRSVAVAHAKPRPGGLRSLLPSIPAVAAAAQKCRRQTPLHWPQTGLS